jgi:putative flippase GtrA
VPKLHRPGVDLTRRFASFGLVGASGAMVNLSLFWLLTQRLSTPYALAAPMAFEVAMFSNFLLNHHVTFSHQRSASGGIIDPSALLRYQLTALVGLAISLSVLHLSVMAFAIPPMLGNVLGIGAATGATFALSLRWAWQPDRPRPAARVTIAKPA